MVRSRIGRETVRRANRHEEEGVELALLTDLTIEFRTELLRRGES